LESDAVVPEYTAGDNIRLDLAVTHAIELDLQRVIATFRREEGDHDTGTGNGPNSIELRAPTILREEHRKQPTATDRTSESHVILTGKVRRNVAPGEYRCRRVVARYEKNRRVAFDLEETPDIRFRVVGAPVAKPRVTAARFF
jgi:hypothetical protein